jgi:hypothetical protein
VERRAPPLGAPGLALDFLEDLTDLRELTASGEAIPRIERFVESALADLG